MRINEAIEASIKTYNFFRRSHASWKRSKFTDESESSDGDATSSESSGKPISEVSAPESSTGGIGKSRIPRL